MVANVKKSCRFRIGSRGPPACAMLLTIGGPAMGKLKEVSWYFYCSLFAQKNLHAYAGCSREKICAQCGPLKKPCVFLAVFLQWDLSQRTSSVKSLTEDNNPLTTIARSTFLSNNSQVRYMRFSVKFSVLKNLIEFECVEHTLQMSIKVQWL